MRFLLVLLTLVSFRSFAITEARCSLSNGIYINSQNVLEEMNFETLVDVFTINNANALNFTLDGKQMRFLRSEMNVKKVTKMTYMMRKNGKPIRVVRLMIDRTPKEVSIDHQFYGNMVISPELNEFTDFTKIMNSENLVYNFYCEF